MVPTHFVSFCSDQNFIGIQYFQKGDGVNTAVMKFERQHPFLTKWLYAVPSKYMEEDRVCIGPRLVTDLLVPYCQMDVPAAKKSSHLQEISDTHCDFDLHVLPPSAFYQIPWPDWKHLFSDDPDPKLTLARIDDPKVKVVHLWNELSAAMPDKEVKTESPFMTLARKHCPMSYWRSLAKKEVPKLESRHYKYLIKWGANLHLPDYKDNDG